MGLETIIALAIVGGVAAKAVSGQAKKKEKKATRQRESEQVAAAAATKKTEEAAVAKKAEADKAVATKKAEEDAASATVAEEEKQKKKESIQRRGRLALIETSPRGILDTPQTGRRKLLGSRPRESSKGRGRTGHTGPHKPGLFPA